MNQYVVGAVFLVCGLAGVSHGAELSVATRAMPGSVQIVLGKTVAGIYVDTSDRELVQTAANLLANDVQQVTDRRPNVVHNPSFLGKHAVIIGSIGNSAVIDQLVADRKLDVSDVRGQWETYKIAILQKPLPNVESALVIAGSDRRGTAYGVFTLSRAIGVSPWYWWADIPPQHRDAIVIPAGIVKDGPPSVRYRGIFINDEDWGLQPWASRTFDQKAGNIGPKTYEKVYELLLRLKGNYIWPAMHEVTREFPLVAGNIETADRWGIVAGASHPEPMNRNNVHWNQENRGPWRYDTNRDAVMAYWEESARDRGKFEAVWTVGMRGVHDAAMQGPTDMPGRVKLLEQAISDQRDLLRKHANPDILKTPQIFTPYKEALQMYQAGLKVPDDVTIVWTEDNYGYIRQLSNPMEQARSGGSGVYYHLSYLGSPFSYVWINTTPPALIWEEMFKAYSYGADRVWVLNAGDVKPGEIGIDFWMRMGWNISAYDRETVPRFLSDYFAEIFGKTLAAEIAPLMDQYFRLGFQRKPESLHREPNLFSTDNYDEAFHRISDYGKLLAQADAIAKKIPANRKDSYEELVRYPVHMAALTNEVFLCSSLYQKFTASKDPRADAFAHRVTVALQRIEARTAAFNDQLAGGKWKLLMTVKGTTSDAWGWRWPSVAAVDASTKDPLRVPFATPNLQARPRTAHGPQTFAEKDGYVSMEAEHATRTIARNGAAWQTIPGLGRTGDSVSVYPVTIASVVDPARFLTQAPALEYDFTSMSTGSAKVTTYNLPTRRINDARGLRYAVAIDDAQPQIVDFNIMNESDQRWRRNVMWNSSMDDTMHMVARPGRHTLRIWMVDPGVVIDKIVIDFGGVKPSYLGPPESVATSRP